MSKNNRVPLIGDNVNLAIEFGVAQPGPTKSVPPADTSFVELIEPLLAETDFGTVLAEKEEAARAAREATDHILESHPTEPEDQIDLHENTVPEAVERTRSFIDRCKSMGLRTVLVITGKGLHSEDGIPRIRPAVEEKLIVWKRKGTILAFGEGNGGGAFKVFLPKRV